MVSKTVDHSRTLFQEMSAAVCLNNHVCTMSAQCLVPFTKGARDKIIDLCHFLSSSRDETITLLVLQIKGFVIFF